MSIAIFSDHDLSFNFIEKKFKLNRMSIEDAEKEMQAINNELLLTDEIEIRKLEELWSVTASGYDSNVADNTLLTRFLILKDQEETHQDLKKFGQNLFSCYSMANFFLYQNKNLSRQIQRFIYILFNDPFAEPTYEEYFMFCAQAEAYRSLDLDRQVGAVIVNDDNEIVASGFNDVSKVGGGHFAHHDHPMHEQADKEIDYRDFKHKQDYNHTYLDQIAKKIAHKLGLDTKDQLMLREEITGITEFKRSTHAEMSALLDASLRGAAVKNCTIYVNFYPCHNCTKHLIAAGIKKIIFVHPYTKSKASDMYSGMIKHGLFIDEKSRPEVVIFEPFLGVSPNRFMSAFTNDKDSRLEKENERENGKIQEWEINHKSIPRELRERKPHSYISREWSTINGRLPDMSIFYKEPSP